MSLVKQNPIKETKHVHAQVDIEHTISYQKNVFLMLTWHHSSCKAVCDYVAGQHRKPSDFKPFRLTMNLFPQNAIFKREIDWLATFSGNTNTDSFGPYYDKMQSMIVGPGIYVYNIWITGM
jgi:hypothetical protein